MPSRVTRAVPYPHTPAQLSSLLTRARTLLPAVYGLTLATVIGLMAATGMRIGEALALKTTSLDVTDDALAVIGKYGKQRRIPVHPSTTAALTSYLRTSRTLVGSPHDQALFVTVNATRPLAGNVEKAFRALTTACQLQRGTGRNEPRLHDLRQLAASTFPRTRESGSPSPAISTSSARGCGRRPPPTPPTACSTDAHRRAAQFHHER